MASVYLDKSGVEYLWGKIVDRIDDTPSTVPFAQVDSASTSTAFTATVPGITELRDGVMVLLKNGVVTSAAGFTININGLGAKPVYTNLAAATAETTKFNVNYTMLFVYDSTRISGGAWICYNGYDSNTNTIGYQLRTNSYTLPMSDRVYRYRLLFSSVDGTKWVPANTSTSTNATASRTPCTTPIDPFGPIVYYGTTTAVAAGSNPGATSLWQQYVLSLGYSFNTTGAALTLTYPAPVYVKCTPQTTGGVVMDGYTQALPNTADGYVYLFLGIAYSATNIELLSYHPVYEYKDGAIRLYTNATAGSSVTVDSALSASSENPVQNKVINTALSSKAATTSVPSQASIDSTGLISFKNGSGTTLFTVQLPVYAGGVS